MVDWIVEPLKAGKILDKTGFARSKGASGMAQQSEANDLGRQPNRVVVRRNVGIGMRLRSLLCPRSRTSLVSGRTDCACAHCAIRAVLLLNSIIESATVALNSCDGHALTGLMR